MRQVLPQRRHAETYELMFSGKRFAVTVGYFADLRTPGEVFVHGYGVKCGAALDAVARDASILLSFCMQHSIPLDTIRGALTREQDGSPSSLMGAIVDRIVTVREVPS